ncbi:Phosphoribosylformylglycinamidine synthase [Hypsibius exemplaris]|uniref:Phosphoribosylformylglycinamidine synthase n=1 Tax=Hypsibius exemplaris TaxID=2072580 RepID=A0A1W0WAJ6_HYPEX|nr:Phosphoribosylformylglycinamidine synthase [Hypsibius exemplaris]
MPHPERTISTWQWPWAPEGLNWPKDAVGSATAIGEQPIKMLFDVKRGARMSVIESLTNLMFAKISSIRDVKCSGNWMWPAKLPGEGAALYDACEAMCGVMKELGIAVDGGKDSLSMAAKCGDEIVKAPGTLVISTYAPCPDIRKKITPDLKVPGGKGSLFWIDLSKGKRRLGGSAFAQANGRLSQLLDVPDVDAPDEFVTAFQCTQDLINDGKLTAGHDISDGGLITCLLEMAFAGNAVFDVDLPESAEFGAFPENILFAEEVGWLLESSAANQTEVQAFFNASGIPCYLIGHSFKQLDGQRKLRDENVFAPFVRVNGQLVYGNEHRGIASLRAVWEEFGYQIERLQCSPRCADTEKATLLSSEEPNFVVNFSVNFDVRNVLTFQTEDGVRLRVAVIREEGSNGDREMAAALHMVGFDVWDVNVQDLLENKVDLQAFCGLVFVGGFSYADVFGSAKGWAAVLAFNPATRAGIDAFFRRNDTFTLGICNGCQLLTTLGLVGQTGVKEPTVDVNTAPVALKHNLSGRFESRFSTVKIPKSKAMMLRGMEGSQLGIWTAHGEGRFEFRDGVTRLRAEGCVALEFIDSRGAATEVYPLNPNGSPEGIAGICSTDGRHLVMMPHPERTILTWQWPWAPEGLNWPKDAVFSPWIKMFRNAFEWCNAPSDVFLPLLTAVVKILGPLFLHRQPEPFSALKAHIHFRLETPSDQPVALGRYCALVNQEACKDELCSGVTDVGNDASSSSWRDQNGLAGFLTNFTRSLWEWDDSPVRVSQTAIDFTGKPTVLSPMSAPFNSNSSFRLPTIRQVFTSQNYRPTFPGYSIPSSFSSASNKDWDSFDGPDTELAERASGGTGNYEAVIIGITLLILCLLVIAVIFVMAIFRLRNLRLLGSSARTSPVSFSLDEMERRQIAVAYIADPPPRYQEAKPVCLEPPPSYEQSTVTATVTTTTEVAHPDATSGVAPPADSQGLHSNSPTSAVVVPSESILHV